MEKHGWGRGEKTQAENPKSNQRPTTKYTYDNDDLSPFFFCDNGQCHPTTLLVAFTYCQDYLVLVGRAVDPLSKLSKIQGGRIGTLPE